ncbi:MAG: M48 family metalloprotease [Desulfosarcina sp.]
MTRDGCLAVGLIWLCVSVATAWALETPVDSNHALRLERLAAQEQALLAQRGIVLHDAGLSTYLQCVTRRLWEQVNSDLKAPVVAVVTDTRMEAYAYPNGYCFLTTGMIDQLENEDQLAMILAHELIHYARRHTVALYHHLQRNRTNASPVFAARRTSSDTDVQRAVAAAESQADREGLSILMQAGYRAAQVPVLMENLLNSTRHRAAPAFVKELENRIHAINRCLDATRDDGFRGSTWFECDPDRFSDCIAPALLANAQAAVRAGDWARADKSLGRLLLSHPNDARAYYLKGEIQRRHSAGSDSNFCVASYEQALKIDPMFSPAHRALGEMHFKAGQYRQAKRYFETFLSLSPQDESRGFIKEYLSQCIE